MSFVLNQSRRSAGLKPNEANGRVGHELVNRVNWVIGNVATAACQRTGSKKPQRVMRERVAR
jgi:hypothetical protein